MRINIVCVGKIKENFYVQAINEYQKRLQKYCTCKIIEIPEVTFYDVDKCLEIEGNDIQKSLRGQVLIMDINGEMLSSEQLAKQIADVKNFGCGEITFVVGSSHGLCEKIKGMGKSISFGRVTFPHQLMRVILSEQIYRAFCIINNTPYHK